MADIFDKITELPNSKIKENTESLVGFEAKFDRIYGNLKLILSSEELKNWSNKFYKKELPIIKHIEDRYPLIILSGDVGTGKTISAISFADRMLRELDKEGFFLKLSTRVRGEGLHGEMGNLVNDAFDELKKQAGKRRIAFLFIDEADAIATTRSTSQMHQEEKAAVNTLIQKIDEIREMKGRAVVFMSTNRLHFLDEALVRRAAVILEYNRPDFDERRELFTKSLEGVKITEKELDELSQLTSDEQNNGVGYSFSDIRLRILPEAVASAFPDRPLSYEILCETIAKVKPSPKIK